MNTRARTHTHTHTHKHTHAHKHILSPLDLTNHLTGTHIYLTQTHTKDRQTDTQQTIKFHHTHSVTLTSRRFACGKVTFRQFVVYWERIKIRESLLPSDPRSRSHSPQDGFVAAGIYIQILSGGLFGGE